MALAQPVLPGKVYMLTRRCYQRTYRLRPSEQTNNIFRYALAYAAQKTAVSIHAVVVMSNHHHIVLTDIEGKLPDFMRELHRSVAKAINAAQGQWENLWSNEHYHRLLLGSDEDIINQIAYLAANPVAAGLVESPEEWPGVMLLPEEEQQSMDAVRPDKYFSAHNPEQLALHITPPNWTREDDWMSRVTEAIETSVQKAREKVIAEGHAFMGREAVLAQSFVKRAKSFELRRSPIPKVRARNTAVWLALLAAYRQFRVRYLEAWKAFREGVRDVVFPAGTWQMRVVFRVRVESFEYSRSSSRLVLGRVTRSVVC